MKIRSAKVDDIVQIVFWDHAENFHDAMQFEVIGKVTKITERIYQINCWFYHDPLQRAADSNASDNETYFAIVRSAIDSIRILK